MSAVHYIRSTRSELLTEFGTMPDYYPREEVTRELECLWRGSARDWADAIEAAEAAIVAGDSEGRKLALDRASRIERQWGDDPATRRFLAMFSGAA